MFENLPKEATKELFALLRSGKFLSQNSPFKEEKRLFRFCEDHNEELKELLSFLGIELVLKSGYCYFASYENKESKLKTIYELIDYLSFFFHFYPSFGVGSRVSIIDIEHKIKDDLTLKDRLKKLKALNDATLKDAIVSLVGKLEKQGYMALEDEYTHTYVVLDSIEYHIEFFNKIEIKDE